MWCGAGLKGNTVKSMGDRATAERLERMRASPLWAGSGFRHRARIAPGLLTELTERFE